MISGPHTSATRRLRVEVGVGDELRDDTDGPGPAGVGDVDGDLDVAPCFRHSLDFVGEDDLVRVARPDEDDNLASALVGERRDEVDDGAAQRGEPDPAGDDDDVASVEAVDRPVGPERSAHADDVTRSACDSA